MNWTCRECGVEFVPETYHLKSYAHMCRPCIRKNRRQYFARHHDQRRLYRRIYQLTHQHKQRARREVHKKIASGELQRQPCEVCGCLPVEAHHPDYDKPLEIKWLCKQHHIELHNPKTYAPPERIKRKRGKAGQS